jgi:hypothetical protein
VSDQTQSPKTPKKKEPRFKDIEDVISVGALLRPTFVSAVKGLKTPQKEQLFDILLKAEKELARSELSFHQRFEGLKRILERTYVMGPMWRFIAGRIEETWREVEEPGVKELSTVSLLVGILFEETESQLEQLGIRRSA